MAQKINPISLRLGKTNRDFDCCWYNSSNYVYLLMTDFKIKNYINTILRKIHFSSAKFLTTILHNKIKINVFFCNPSKSRHLLAQTLRVTNHKKKKPSTARSAQRSKKRNSFFSIDSTRLRFPVQKLSFPHIIGKKHTSFDLPVMAQKKKFFNTNYLANSEKQARVYNYLTDGFLTTSALCKVNATETYNVSSASVKVTKTPFRTASEAGQLLKTTRQETPINNKSVVFSNYIKHSFTVEKQNQLWIRYFIAIYFSKKVLAMHSLQGSDVCIENPMLVLYKKSIYISLTCFLSQFLQSKNFFLSKKNIDSSNSIKSKTQSDALLGYSCSILAGIASDNFIVSKRTTKLESICKSTFLSNKFAYYKNKILMYYYFNENTGINILSLKKPSSNPKSEGVFATQHSKKNNFKLFLPICEIISKKRSFLQTILEKNINITKVKKKTLLNWFFFYPWTFLPQHTNFADASHGCASRFGKTLYVMFQQKYNSYTRLSLINKQYLDKTYSNYCNLSKNSLTYNAVFLKNIRYQLSEKLDTKYKENGDSTKLVIPSSTYKHHIEYMIFRNLACNVNLQFYKTLNIFQSALYLINEIVYYIEKKVPFFKLKNSILRILTQQKSLRIKGIRVMCSGRVGGKSKKAQKAKIQSFKYGETSLHMFSSKIDFKAKNAFTNFGTLGIKIWICYL